MKKKRIYIFLVIVTCGILGGQLSAGAAGDVWIALTADSKVVKLSPGGEEKVIELADRFKMPMDIDIDPKAGCVWALDKAAGEAHKISLGDGKELGKFTGLKDPFHGTVETRTGTYFAADEGNKRVVRVSADGLTQLSEIIGLEEPHDIAYSDFDDTIWVSDRGVNMIMKFSLEGKKLAETSEIKRPHHMAVDGKDGSLWV